MTVNYLRKQDLPIVQDFIEINKYSRPGYEREQTLGGLLHWTGNARPSATAWRTGDYFENLVDRYASTPYIVGRDPIVRQIMGISEVAYHAGARWADYTDFAKKILTDNPKSKLKGYMSINHLYVGIEMVPYNTNGNFTDETILTTCKLLALILTHYNLDPTKEESISTHHAMTGKLCPKYVVENPKVLDEMRTEVKGLMRRGV